MVLMIARHAGLSVKHAAEMNSPFTHDETRSWPKRIAEILHRRAAGIPSAVLCIHSPNYSQSKSAPIATDPAAVFSSSDSTVQTSRLVVALIAVLSRAHPFPAFSAWSPRLGVILRTVPAIMRLTRTALHLSSNLVLSMTPKQVLHAFL